MVEDKPEDIDPSTDSGRAKRAAPTIDLDPSEVSGETRAASSEPQPEAEPAPARHEEPAPTPPPPIPPPISPPISPWVIAPVSGAAAAALVIAVGWVLGWPAIQPAAPQPSAAAIDELTGRVAGLESKTSKPATPAADPAAVARIEALEKSVSGLRAQTEKLAAGVTDLKSMPRENSASPDLSGISERIAGIERAVRAGSAENAQQDAKPAPADDVPLRRVVVASLLDVSVRTGDPYPAALAAAKSLAANPQALKPLDNFAAKGVPNAASLSRELLALVPKLSPPAPENSATAAGTGLVDRLQAGAAKLVRIERTDTNGNDRGAVIARVTAAALRNDSNEARRELKTLEPVDRAPAQAWIDKADARDAALATSRQFAAEAMTALAQPAQ